MEHKIPMAAWVHQGDLWFAIRRFLERCLSRMLHFPGREDISQIKKKY
jgi:hypothetical protein